MLFGPWNSRVFRELDLILGERTQCIWSTWDLVCFTYFVVFVFCTRSFHSAEAGLGVFIHLENISKSKRNEVLRLREGPAPSLLPGALLWAGSTHLPRTAIPVRLQFLLFFFYLGKKHPASPPLSL